VLIDHLLQIVAKSNKMWSLNDASASRLNALLPMLELVVCRARPHSISLQVHAQSFLLNFLAA